MDPDMTPGIMAAFQAQVSPWSQVAMQTFQIGIASMGAYSLDTNIVAGDGPDFGCLHGP